MSSEWLDGLDVVTMQSHALAGNFVQARELHDAVASAETRASVAQVLCPGVISQVALAEGALQEAEALSQRSLASARRLAIDRQFLPTWAMRTAALLALERHDLEAAERLTEQILDRLGWRPPQPGLPGPTGPGPDLGGRRQLRRSLIFATSSPGYPSLRSVHHVCPSRRARSPLASWLSGTEMERSASPSGYPTIVGRLCWRSSPSPPRTLKKPQIS